MCILEYYHLKNKMMKYEAPGKENTKLRIVADKDSATVRYGGRSSFMFGIYPTLAAESVKK